VNDPHQLGLGHLRLVPDEVVVELEALRVSDRARSVGLAALVTDTNGHTLDQHPTVGIDTARNQITVLVPSAAWRAGVLEPVLLPAVPYTREFQTWSGPRAVAPASTLAVTLTNVARATVDTEATKLPSGEATVISDGASTLTLANL
jgi:hypothetical protein